MKSSLLLILVLTTGAHATDKFFRVWEERVFSADNPAAKAHDMCIDWCFDHRKKLKALDEATLARGEQIVEWMDKHDFALPYKVQVAYHEFRDRLLEREVARPSMPVPEISPFATVALPVPEETKSTAAEVYTAPYNYDGNFPGDKLPPPVHGAREP